MSSHFGLTFTREVQAVQDVNWIPFGSIYQSIFGGIYYIESIGSVHKMKVEEAF